MVKKAKKKISKSPKAKGWGKAEAGKAEIVKPAKRSTKKRKARKLSKK